MDKTFAYISGKKRGKIAELEARRNGKLSYKVTAPKLVDGKMKGTSGQISLYGFHGKFPVTLTPKNWRRLHADAAAFEAFVKANASLIDADA